MAIADGQLLVREEQALELFTRDSSSPSQVINPLVPGRGDLLAAAPDIILEVNVTGDGDAGTVGAAAYTLDGEVIGDVEVFACGQPCAVAAALSLDDEGAPSVVIAHVEADQLSIHRRLLDVSPTAISPGVTANIEVNAPVAGVVANRDIKLRADAVGVFGIIPDQVFDYPSAGGGGLRSDPGVQTTQEIARVGNCLVVPESTRLLGLRGDGTFSRNNDIGIAALTVIEVKDGDATFAMAGGGTSAGGLAGAAQLVRAPVNDNCDVDDEGVIPLGARRSQVDIIGAAADADGTIYVVDSAGDVWQLPP